MKPSDFLTELSTEKLAQYKTAAAADASKADKAGEKVTSVLVAL